MPLKLRPSGLGSGIDKDRPDYVVLSGEWEIGRIYRRGRPQSSGTARAPDARFVIGARVELFLKPRQAVDYVLLERRHGARHSSGNSAASSSCLLLHHL
jgi:hypothetical protein